MEECTVDDLEKDQNGQLVLDSSGKPIHISKSSSKAAYESYAYWVRVTGHGIGLSRQKFSKRLIKCCESYLISDTRMYRRRILHEWFGVSLEAEARKSQSSNGSSGKPSPRSAEQSQSSDA